MSLCQPNIVGPLSEISTSVRVQGQMAGATVTVVSLIPTLHQVAEGLATSGDQRFPLDSGVHLSAGDLLVAIQKFGGDRSALPTGNLGMGVQPKPKSSSEIGHVGFDTHPYTCGQFVWISGAVPGAVVEVVTNHVFGSGTADEGYARFKLTEPLPSVTVDAHQIVPGLPNGPNTGRFPDPIPDTANRALPAPLMNQPIRGCDAAVNVSRVFDGSVVSIERSSGPTETAGFDRDALWFVMQSGLVEGEKLRVRQDVYARCERPGTWSSPPLIVGPLKPVDPPAVDSPLCAGTTRVHVRNLRPGAILHIQANGGVFDATIPAGATAFDVTIPPLQPSTLGAVQELCGVRSIPVFVHVDAHQANVPGARIVGPLFECARSVSVDNVHKGATIQIFAQKGPANWPISDLVTLLSTQGTVAVNPYLREGDEIFALQWACSDTAVRSTNSILVGPHPNLLSTTALEPILSGDTVVAVADALPGALVEVYVQRGPGGLTFAGARVADALDPITNVHTIPLQTRDVVTSRQFLCGAASEPGTPVSVQPAPVFGPRPFYVVGHNPNTIADVKKALHAGANAIEPDVNVFEDHQDQLCISHGEGEPGAPSLEQFLKDLRQVAQDNHALSLVVFDCKEKVATPGHGTTLLNAIRKFLTHDTQLNIIISVGNLSMTAIFDNMMGQLGPREGVMIDEENDPIAVSNFFTIAGVQNQCYGNGISVFNSILGPHVRPSMERACEFRAEMNRTRFIYVWTVNDDDLMFEYIRIGIDGIITDDVGKLNNIAHDPQFASIIRLANRNDDPFRPSNFTYGLTIHTGDVWMGGTDANVTFTLTGLAGTASKQVDTSLHGRMERNDWNYVTMQSPDLGALQSITVQRDNDGNGPDWYLDRIKVHSFRFGVSKEAVFNRWIDNTGPFTRALV
jgi:glycerophosphoryl diester phosphodiesterase